MRPCLSPPYIPLASRPLLGLIFSGLGVVGGRGVCVPVEDVGDGAMVSLGDAKLR